MTCSTCIYLGGTPGRQHCGLTDKPIYGRAHLTYSCQEWHDKMKPEGALWPAQAKRVAPAPVLDAQGREITIDDIFPD